jgi:hypothetical protein
MERFADAVLGVVIFLFACGLLLLFTVVLFYAAYTIALKMVW